MAGEKPPFSFKGLTLGQQIAPLESSGLLTCKRPLSDSRTAICAAQGSALKASKYHSFSGEELDGILIHALDGRIVRLAAGLVNKSRKVRRKSIDALSHKYGSPDATIELNETFALRNRKWFIKPDTRFHSELIWNTKPAYWINGSEHMMLHNMTYAERIVNHERNLLAAHSYGPGIGPSSRGTMGNISRLIFLLVSDDYEDARDIWDDASAEKARQEEAARMARNVDDF